MSLLKRLFKKSEEVDYSQPMFFAKQLNQTGYDPEIDEGMSSGMRRYVTLDVTKLSEKQVSGLLEKLVREATDFHLCKLVQVSGFNKEGRRYVTVSGESHRIWQISVKNAMLEKLTDITDKLPVEYVEAHIDPPVQGGQHQLTNLGPYGSTGSPAFGILQHPDAQELREKGKIR